MTSEHYLNDRIEREALIKAIGEGQIIKSVIVDRGHRNGPEVHKVSDTGIVSIYNQHTGKLITKLIARPAQVRRYYPDDSAPKWLLEIARKHQALGYNR